MWWNSYNLVCCGRNYLNKFSDIGNHFLVVAFFKYSCFAQINSQLNLLILWCVSYNFLPGLTIVLANHTVHTRSSVWRSQAVYKKWSIWKLRLQPTPWVFGGELWLWSWWLFSCWSRLPELHGCPGKSGWSIQVRYGFEFNSSFVSCKILLPWIRNSIGSSLDQHTELFLGFLNGPDTMK